MTQTQQSNIVQVVDSQECCDPLWEQAYLRFETPQEERHKFLRRMRALGVPGWPRDSQIVDLFCGRGSGLLALEELGFQHIEGVDLSGSLLANYCGPATLYIADCRQLPFQDASRDALMVQGGLHHLPCCPDDVEQVFREVHRVLRPQGRFLVVEPWLTPFLRVVHAVCRWSLLCRLWPRLAALATMIRQEQVTYDRWLSQGAAILPLLDCYFESQIRRVGWGKLMFVGHKRKEPASAS